ncbi:MAG: transcription termination/antitermination protein NusG [Limisphaerales bacterium]|jgi:transcription antitermination factor NusG|nr:antitermination protein NusG [Pedosphaera sp.]MBL6844252.1 UpxY family transcription antiterminator [Verrucomicrobiae bacterium]RZO70599.1 MAG: antitermination protein NusG [Limisphaerales bacterium]HAQ99416.1 antitermination protein NusG [Verrucomicrobiales bacterium]HAW01200.1 antitermination protein NusG [Verrucomicrobiales bacterium]|tara:strand:+ start:4004 stop:4516 length:513 start_codon:yes stop_codon:yes gene_type:complete
MKSPQVQEETDIEWFVAHTRPRCEKKLRMYLDRELIYNILPTVQSVHKYRGKTVSFDKPLFPGYVFLKIDPLNRQKVYQSDYVANLLDVPDQEGFHSQLADIFEAIESGCELKLAPEIGAGKRVIIKSGPMRGIEGWVEDRYGRSTVLLRLDFIGQAAALSMEADMLELV